jgi:hypothetical protein
MRLGPLDAADFANLGDLFVVDSAAGLAVSIALAVALVVVGTALIFVLLPGIVFVLELLVLPFFVLLFRGARVVEARNETTGDVLRFPVHGRAEARERERSLAAELGAPAAS